MSDPSSSSSGSREWNLGKSKPAPSPAPPPKTAPPPPPPPAANKVIDAILAKDADLPPLGRPVPEAKGIRAGLNHPLVMAASGLVVVIAILYLILGGSLAWLISGRSSNIILPPTPEERAAALVEGVGDQGRLLVMGGQILEASAGFLASPAGSRQGSEDRYEYIPEHLTRMRMPAPDSPQFIEFRLKWDQQAQASIELGQHVIQTARSQGVAPENLRRLAARLRAEGLAVMDYSLAGADRAGISGIDGARARLMAGSNIMPREEADALIEALMNHPLGNEMANARPGSDSPVAQMDDTEAAP